MLGLPRQAMSLKYVALSRRRVVSIGPYGCQVNAPFFPKHVFCCRKFIGRISPPDLTEKASTMMAVAAPNLPPVPLAVRGGCTGNVVANIVANFVARFVTAALAASPSLFTAPLAKAATWAYTQRGGTTLPHRAARQTTSAGPQSPPGGQNGHPGPEAWPNGYGAERRRRT